MNSVELLALVDELDGDIDEVEEQLEPLFTEPLSTTTKKLPLLDKAKLYVTVVYAIESLLFTYLRLHGVEAKEHAVFKELTRVRHYFAKISGIENGPTKSRENMSLNKEAAGRIIKHALSGNNKIDLELREKQAREALLARRKLKELEDKSKPSTPEELPLPQSEPNDTYLSEGEIEDDTEPTQVEPSILSSTAPDQETSEGEVLEGKSPSRKRRKSGGKKSKSKKQKRKQASASTT